MLLSVAIVLLVIAGISAVFARIAYRQIADAEVWPTTQGRITRSEIARENRHAAVSTRARTVWALHVEYQYAVDTHVYTGRRISSLADERNAGPADKGPPVDLVVVRNRYSEGAEVQVRYDPKQPDSAYLEIAHAPMRVACLIAAAAAILGLAGLVFALKH